MPQSLLKYFYAAQIKQIAPFYIDNLVEKIKMVE